MITFGSVAFVREMGDSVRFYNDLTFDFVLDLDADHEANSHNCSHYATIPSKSVTSWNQVKARLNFISTIPFCIP